MELFDLMNDIEDCPATLLSANRHFITKCDVKLLLEKDGIDDYEQQYIRKLENCLFTLLLFTDCILLCKKRIVTRSTSLKDRANIPMSASKKSKKTYRFIETIDLSSLKCIINEFDEGGNSLSLSLSLGLLTYILFRFGSRLSGCICSICQT